MSFVLGKLDVVMPTRDKRFNYKLDYEGFKRRFSIVSLILALFAFVLPRLSLPTVAVSTYDSVLLVCQLFFHVGLLFRESILIKNGSRINQYWILHHYGTTLLLFLLLITPFNDQYLRIRSHIALFSMCTSLFHFIRHKRAMQRYYADLATEQAHFMDVIDSTRELGIEDNSSWLNLPLSSLMVGLTAVGMHAYQNFIGLLATYISFQDRRYDALFWTGIVLFLLGIGNCVTTLIILFSRIGSRGPNHRSRSVPGFPNKKLTIPALHKMYAHLTENECDSDESSTTEFEEFKLGSRTSDPLSFSARIPTRLISSPSK
ncbi:hypothetical protein GEMRC1_009091 [Eukaryota sp. GEM-RC1]